MKKLLSFDTLITPTLVRILFWLLIAICLYVSCLNIIRHDWYHLVLTLILAPLAIRIAAEAILVIFGIHKELVKLNQARG